MKKVKITKAEALTYLDMGKDVTSLFLYRVLNSLRWKTSPIQPSPPIEPPKLSLADLPVGYNLRNKKITFDRIDLAPDFDSCWAARNDQGYILEVAGSWQDCSIWVGSFSMAMYAMLITPYNPETPKIMTLYNWNDQQWPLNGLSPDGTDIVLSDKDMIITTNTLPRSVNGSWGFEYAYVTDL